jgi:FtsP/CotA-like multicopper oxidase with cupredoxin domain
MRSRSTHLLAGLAASALASLSGCEPTVEPVVPAATAAPAPTPAATEAPEAAPGPPTAGLVKPAAVYEGVKPHLNALAKAASDCPPYQRVVLDLEHGEPTKIEPVDGVIGTQIVVAMKSRCVPVFVTKTATGAPVTPPHWENRRMDLRTYGFPKDPKVPITVPKTQAEPFDIESDTITWSAPGPTFELRKASKDGKVPGTKLGMTLINAMPYLDKDKKPLDPHTCDVVSKLAQPGATPPAPAEGPNAGGTPPNCFHGDNSTNFHMHGSHVSPQPHQDFVGLELLPWGATISGHGTHGSRGITKVGIYDYEVDPIDYHQAEGTHWYHAHKHGATALQVLNGLTGAFLIRGEFDDKLDAYFKQQHAAAKLKEHLLVVQQVQELPPSLGGGEPPAAALVNGHGNPIIQMFPGEIQRWRFIGATQNSSANFTIHLPEGFAYAQIAMDGVQFSPDNYICQPLIAGTAKACKTTPTSTPLTVTQAAAGKGTITIGPATRVDLLVQAPAAAKPGTYASHYEAPVIDAKRRLRKQSARVLAPTAPVSGDLLTVEIIAGPVPLMKFPTRDQYPAMPDFLTDIKPVAPATSYVPTTVAYQLENQASFDETNFTINTMKYNPSCANETMVLGVAQEWTLTNNSGIAHPFHIHTNPFQVVSLQEWKQLQVDPKTKKPTGPYTSVITTYQSPIWRDTLPIPTGNPDDPTRLGGAVIRYLPRDFTGEFVNHCHILGHEDRGMMHNVQVICPQGNINDPTTWQFGNPSATVPECSNGGYNTTTKPNSVCGLLPPAPPGK